MGLEKSLIIGQLIEATGRLTSLEYLVFAIFALKRGDPQIRIQAKQERRTSEYRKRGEGGVSAQHRQTREAPHKHLNMSLNTTPKENNDATVTASKLPSPDHRPKQKTKTQPFHKSSQQQSIPQS